MMKLSAVAMSISRVMMFWVMSSSVMISKATACEVKTTIAASSKIVFRIAVFAKMFFLSFDRPYLFGCRQGGK